MQGARDKVLLVDVYDVCRGCELNTKFYEGKMAANENLQPLVKARRKKRKRKSLHKAMKTGEEE